MALKDSFINLNKALRTTLQNVPAVVDTLVRGLDGVAEAAEEENTYSATEHTVGTWTDGSKVYEAVVNLGNMPNGTNKTVEHNLNIKEVISFEVIMTNNVAYLNIPYIYNDGTFINAYCDANRIIVQTNRDATNYIAKAIIRYTKASASRSPEENDTKNGGDEEPDVKTVDEPVVKTVDEPAEDLKK